MSTVSEYIWYIKFKNANLEQEAKTFLGKSNALRRAISYLDYSPYSKSGLIKQLKFKGFTSEQAKYAAKKVGYK